MRYQYSMKNPQELLTFKKMFFCPGLFLPGFSASLLFALPFRPISFRLGILRSIFASIPPSFFAYLPRKSYFCPHTYPNSALANPQGKSASFPVPFRLWLRCFAPMRAGACAQAKMCFVPCHCWAFGLRLAARFYARAVLSPDRLVIYPVRVKPRRHGRPTPAASMLPAAVGGSRPPARVAPLLVGGGWPGWWRWERSGGRSGGGGWWVACPGR